MLGLLRVHNMVVKIRVRRSVARSPYAPAVQSTRIGGGGTIYSEQWNSEADRLFANHAALPEQ